MPAYDPAVAFGGPVTKLRLLGGALADMCEVEVWTADYGFSGRKVRGSAVKVDGLKVRYLRTLATYRWSPVCIGVGRALREFAPSIVHCFGYRDPLTGLAAWAAHRNEIPYIAEPLGMTTLGHRNGHLKRVVDRTLGSWYLANAALVVATSAAEEADLRAGGCSRVKVRANPVRVIAVDRLTSPRPREVGWVGRISKSKNLPLLVAALARLPSMGLTIIGPDEGDGALQDLHAAAEEHGVADRVRVYGPLYGDALWEQLDQVAVMVSCSHYESFGNAIVEAASIGLPCVVTPGVGAGPALVALGAAAVAPESPEGLADAIESVFLSSAPPEVRRATAAAVRSEFAAERVASLQRLIYSDVLTRQ